MNILDLFSGCGGLSYGFELAGFKTKLALDNNFLALETFRKNHPSALAICCDIAKSDPIEIISSANLKNVDGVIGGPPCQGFSISGKRDPSDPRNNLHNNFWEYVELLKPKFFIIENVPNLVSMERGAILNKIYVNFSKLGYSIQHKILLASDYGVPQNRKRVFIVGIKNCKREFVFPSIQQDSKVTTYEALSDLPENDIADGTPYPIEPQTTYQHLIRNASQGIWNHETIKHSDTTIETIALVPDGGNYKSLPLHLQNTRKVNIAWTRMKSNAPSFTIDTGHNHHFHYKWNRVPTARESARIQSFPDIFHFVGKKADQLRQIGNAVPPLLAKAIAESLNNLL